MRGPIEIWYNKSAKCFNEALPLANGKLAAMVYGGSNEETIQLDDSTFWSGEASNDNNLKNTPTIIKKIRKLLLAKDYDGADRLGKSSFVGVKHNYGTHMPLGNLKLLHYGMNKVENIKRNLDLFEGVAKTVFTYDGTEWRRACFVSYPAGVFALKYCAKGGNKFSLRITWEGIENNTIITAIDGKDLILKGNAIETLHSDGRTGVALRGRLRVLTDGCMTFTQGVTDLKDATTLVLLVAFETDMISKDPDAVCLSLLQNAEKEGYEQLLTEHCEDIRKNMERVHLTLGEDISDIPTDTLIENYKNFCDPSFEALIFQYGRYLSLASSRERSPIPTHMGGIWNDNIYNKQDSTQDMHLDMNLQMQYWQMFPCGLAECFLPLERWIRETIVPSGEKTARVTYEAEGWVAHITSNPWGYTALGWAHNWGSFSFGGAWCATLLWDYFDFTRDLEYLRQQAYPVLLGSAKFMLDYLFFDKESGYWMTGPSYSPENYYMNKGKQYSLSLSTTCDVLIIREIFTIVLKASSLLDLPKDKTLIEISDRLTKLPPYKIGLNGQIQEWFYDFEEPFPNHRHTSHLLGLYPFSQITPNDTPVLAKAAETSIKRRLKGFEATSWGYNMFASMYARLLDGNSAKKMIEENIRQLTVANLTIVMPSSVPMWAGTWELDGNTGFSAAICEMLAQCHDISGYDNELLYEVRLLPALPDKWPDGEIRGLCLRGGLTLDMKWKNHTLTEALLTPKQNIKLNIIVDGVSESVTAIAGKPHRTLPEPP